jgi:hypothetical protein
LSFVIAAYALAALLIGGYALSVALRRRDVRRALDAWDDPLDAGVDTVAGRGDSDTGSTETGGRNTDADW